MQSENTSLDVNTIDTSKIQITTVNQKRKNDIIKSIDINERSSIENFGYDLQEKVGNFTSSVINQVRTKDAGDAGDALVGLVSILQAWDTNIQTPSAIVKFLSSIPFVRPMVDKGKKIVAEYKTVEENMSASKHAITMRSISIERDNLALDVLFKKQVEYINEIGDHIAAGYEKHNEIVSVDIPALKNKIGDNNNFSLVTQELSDLTKLAKFLENRVFELDQNRVIAMQSLAVIRLIQENNSTLSQKLKSAVTTMIPLWYTQTAIALCLHRQAKDAAVLKQMGDVTTGMLRNNADSLHQISVAVATENERSLVDTKVLKEINGKILASMHDVIKINETGRLNREKGHKELIQIENQLSAAAMRVATSVKQIGANEDNSYDATN